MYLVYSVVAEGQLNERLSSHYSDHSYLPGNHLASSVSRTRSFMGKRARVPPEPSGSLQCLQYTSSCPASPDSACG